MFRFGPTSTYHWCHGQDAGDEAMNAMLDPNDCDSRLFIRIFTLQSESYRSDTQIAVIFIHASGDATVQSWIGEGHTGRFLILQIHLHDNVSNRKQGQIVRFDWMETMPSHDLPVFYSNHYSAVFSNNRTADWSHHMRSNIDRLTLSQQYRIQATGAHSANWLNCYRKLNVHFSVEILVFGLFACRMQRVYDTFASSVAAIIWSDTRATCVFWFNKIVDPNSHFASLQLQFFFRLGCWLGIWPLPTQRWCCVNAKLRIDAQNPKQKLCSGSGRTENEFYELKTSFLHFSI